MKPHACYASDTIFALSSGAPPAAVAIVRISGSDAANAIKAFAGSMPEPRRATLRALHDPVNGDLLDRGLVLWFPGAATVTGEPLAEFHLHGGRAVVQAVLGALASLEGFRPARAGEFTRRAFDNGRIDLLEAQGLADLLEAETQAQRRHALALAGGHLSRLVETWQTRLLVMSARIEAELDFADEDDVPAEAIATIKRDIAYFHTEIAMFLERPDAQRLRDGVTVAIAGPPNVGKSTLLNALAQREAAITSPTAGTTRDIVEVSLAIEGVAFRIADTAGLRDCDDVDDEIEAVGIDRARSWVMGCDILLWLGSPETTPAHPRAIRVASQADRQAGAEWDRRRAASDVVVSAVTGAGLRELAAFLSAKSADLLPGQDHVAPDARQRLAVLEIADLLRGCATLTDVTLVAEHLRLARAQIDRLTGRAGNEAMLDALFSKFCIGK